MTGGTHIINRQSVDQKIHLGRNMRSFHSRDIAFLCLQFLLQILNDRLYVHTVSSVAFIGNLRTFIRSPGFGKSRYFIRDH